FVGFYDSTAGKSPIPDLAFALIDNLKVATMQVPLITKIQNSGGNVQVDFSASKADSPTGFTLQSASSILGPFVVVSSPNSQPHPDPRPVRALWAPQCCSQFPPPPPLAGTALIQNAARNRVRHFLFSRFCSRRLRRRKTSCICAISASSLRRLRGYRFLQLFAA